jgi:hypothetical protein
MMIVIALLALFMRGGFALVYSMILTVSWLFHRTRVEKLGGILVLQVVRPRLKRVETAFVSLYAVLVAISIFYLALIALPAGEVVSLSEVLLILFTWVSLLYWPCFKWRRVEFRERGLVCGHDFWPWEGIREWAWRDGGYSLRLRLPYCINTYGIASEDKNAIQATLEEHLGTMKQR